MLTNIQYSDNKEYFIEEYNQIIKKLKQYKKSIFNNKELSISIRIALFSVILSPKIGTYFVNKFIWRNKKMVSIYLTT